MYGMFKTDFIFYINVVNMFVSWYFSRMYIYPLGIVYPYMKNYYVIYEAGEEVMPDYK